MKHFSKLFLLCLSLSILSCEHLDDFIGDPGDPGDPGNRDEINFTYSNTIQIGGEGAAEISAYDPETKKLFTVNAENGDVTVYDISDLKYPVQLPSIDVSAYGIPNSVAVKDGKLAVALEAPVSQDPGSINIYDTYTQSALYSFTVGALPDMVTFSPDGAYIVSANEGEPDDDYLIENDPDGTVSIIDLKSGEVTTLDFIPFESQKADLTAKGFRVFGPGRSLATDVEPEYVAISDDSKTAWVTLQENNGVAVVNLQTKQIEAIAPLGFKDYSAPGNEIDPSNEDGRKELRSVPVYGIYQPDAIAYYQVNGMDYVVTANEGDARDYDGFSEEERIGDLVLDETAFPDASMLQLEENLGRLQSTTTLGDIDGDGDFDELYNYGARSFSIWSGAGQLVYDSGNDIALQTLNLTPDVFNDDDSRSDDKGAEPEAVEILKIGQKHILFVGLERNDQIMVYDITNPSFPIFMDILYNPGDEAPEGVLAISAEDSPTGKDLLVVSNEDSGTVSFYEN
ncbi:MAG: choice-of-anchor I family protein [Bacteroidota bacterium]